MSKKKPHQNLREKKFSKLSHLRKILITLDNNLITFDNNLITFDNNFSFFDNISFFSDIYMITRDNNF